MYRDKLANPVAVAGWVRAMREAGNVKTKAAQLLGYKSYQTLAAQLERLKVEVPDS